MSSIILRARIEPASMLMLRSSASGRSLMAIRLRLDHDLILDKNTRVCLAQLRRERLIAKLVITHQRPEIHTSRSGLRRDRVQHPAVNALAAVALRRPGTRWRNADIEHDSARGLELDDLPAIDIARLAHCARQNGGASMSRSTASMSPCVRYGSSSSALRQCACCRCWWYARKTRRVRSIRLSTNRR